MDKLGLNVGHLLFTCFLYYFQVVSGKSQSSTFPAANGVIKITLLQHPSHVPVFGIIIQVVADPEGAK